MPGGGNRRPRHNQGRGSYDSALNLHKFIAGTPGNACAQAAESLLTRNRLRFMERVCRQQRGLFPSPVEIKFSCSCPDWAYMCKHVAAVLYGIGARLDTRPEFLFKLRKVKEKDLLAKAGEGLPLAKKGPAAHKVLAAESVAGIFGLDMADGVAEPTAAAPAARRPRAKAKPAPAKQAIKQAKEAPVASSGAPRSAKQPKTAKTRGAAAEKSSAADA